MATKRAAKLVDNEHGEVNNTNVKPLATQKSVNNHLKIRIDDLKTFEPLTANRGL